ncbi:cytochrome-c peroxidase [Phyllobacterium phragmitis]|uniref:Cytochrome-c peroxidase n=1 Tax=Phyllobacterium phragmitis TaxID=2670329 RepID=A0ABQ0GYL7_9HYPH
MRQKLAWALAAAIVIGGPAAAQNNSQTIDDEALRADATSMFKPIPTVQPAPANNPITRDKAELGKMLFFEPRLSSSHLLSCNTCHNLGMGGVDGLETSVGHGWQSGPRNAPTVYNAFFNIAQFWDGRAQDLREQAKGPIQAAVEMNATPDRVLAVLNSMPEYRKLFERAFPGEEETLTFDNVAKAIEAFEATLITPGAHFDQYLEGNLAALNGTEKKGLRLFIDRGCASCHNGINVGGGEYYAFGVVEQPGAEILPPDDKGRFAVTETASDEYVFRAPSLRNVALTAPYFHSGRVWDLKQAVEIMSTSQLGTELQADEVEAIVAFLHTLTGEQPDVTYPMLPASTPTTPRPVLMAPNTAQGAQ